MLDQIKNQNVFSFAHLTYNGSQPLNVNAARILPAFGRKLRNIGKLDCLFVENLTNKKYSYRRVSQYIPEKSNNTHLINDKFIWYFASQPLVVQENNNYGQISNNSNRCY